MLIVAKIPMSDALNAAIRFATHADKHRNAHFVRQDMKRNNDFKSMVFKTYEDTKSRICVYCGDNASNAELNNPNMRFCDALCQKNYYNK